MIYCFCSDGISGYDAQCDTGFAGLKSRSFCFVLPLNPPSSMMWQLTENTSFILDTYVV